LPLARAVVFPRSGSLRVGALSPEPATQAEFSKREHIGLSILERWHAGRASKTSQFSNTRFSLQYQCHFLLMPPQAYDLVTKL
jgi:hypothetical protein